MIKKMSRADFIKSAGLMAAGTILWPRMLYAQDSPVLMIRNEAAKSAVTSQSLRGNIHLLQGSGGNIAVFSGNDGTMMVDSGISVSQNKILRVLEEIGNTPLKFLVNTHWHFDHSEGNEWVHQQGATIIAHKNTKINLSSTITVKDWNYTFPPVSREALPSKVFENNYKLTFNSSDIELAYYKPCHTNSDISVHFTNADILHVGDTWWNAHYPFIDHDSGGSIDGMINACTTNLAMASENTIIIPGHGDPGKRNDLVEYRDMLVAIRERIAVLKKKGMTLEEVVKAHPTASFDKKFGQFVLNGAFFSRIVYADV